MNSVDSERKTNGCLVNLAGEILACGCPDCASLLRLSESIPDLLRFFVVLRRLRDKETKNAGMHTPGYQKKTP